MAGFGAWVNQAAGFFTRDIYQKHVRPSANVHELMVATWTFIATIVGAGFSGVVVAQVVAKRPHPDSTKLTLVDVITAKDGPATQVVCGAPNVPEPGRKVLWARPGATLPGGITLATKPVKGIDSPGMLCAEDELGLGDDHAGIVVLDADDPTALGAPAQRALGIDDWLLDVNVPANRGDCLGHEGLARELAAQKPRMVLCAFPVTAILTAPPADGYLQAPLPARYAPPPYAD